MSTKAFQSLVKELEEFSVASYRRRSKDVASKEKALLAYKRMQFKRAGTTLTSEQNQQLEASVKAKFESSAPKPDTSLLQFLNKDAISQEGQHHVQDITLFLRSQRVYEELLERYNPGISMKQTDKVRKTARTVGLDVPE